MRTLLVFPKRNPLSDETVFKHPWESERPTPPLGITYLGAVLEKAGLPVKLLDCRLSEAKDIIHEIESADIVGISAPSVLAKGALELAGYAKSLGKITVVGGPHATISPDFFLRDREGLVDFVVRGEGEHTLLELVQKLSDGEDWKEVEGIFYLKDSKIVHTPDRPAIRNLDDLPFPARHLLPMKEYLRRWKKTIGYTFLNLLSSRGCPYSCFFCSKEIFGKVYRARSTKNVVDEMEFMVEKYAPDHLFFNDDVFTLNRWRVLQICNELIERRLKVDWGCESRVDTVDHELLKAMKKSGCTRIAYGVESGSQRILNVLKKNVTAEQVKRATSLTKKVGIQVVHYLIVGTPGETVEDIELTKRLIRETNPDYIGVSFFTPFPGGESWKLLEDRLLITDLEQFDYFDSPVFKHENFPPEQLKEIRLEMLKEFRTRMLLSYLSSPRKILRFLRKFRKHLGYWKWIVSG